VQKEPPHQSIAKKVEEPEAKQQDSKSEEKKKSKVSRQVSSPHQSLKVQIDQLRNEMPEADAWLSDKDMDPQVLWGLFEIFLLWILIYGVLCFDRSIHSK
jgi:hypothetical protein